jgi:signal transduction histidine kinase/CheY-like chemotaxis protein
VNGTVDLEHRVLVLAPTVRDALNTSRILGRADIATHACADIRSVCDEISRGAGALVITEETITGNRGAQLVSFLGGQAQWSDLPIIAVTRGGPASAAAVQAMETLGNVILLERPVRIGTFVTAARTALRERDRQYELRRLLAQLHDADRRKDVFLATLAHELRNPLAPIRNASELFRRAAVEEPALGRAADIVSRQVALLVRLVDDLLDVSRITQGKVQLKRQRYDVRESVNQAVETVGPLLQGKRQRLSLRLPAAPLVVNADPARVTQVVGNLLNNAAKYTPEGRRIWLSARRAGRLAIVRVRDDGVGIAPDILPSIFDLFTQGDDSLDRRQGGLGIGLTLVRSIVEMHGGRVRGRSRGRDRGSCFAFCLPAEDVADDEGRPADASAEAMPPLRLLLVDDNVDAVESLAMLLQGAGHDVDIAYDARSALRMIDERQPDLAFLDIGLPEMDGYALAREIRSRSHLRNVVLIALTGYGKPEDRQRAIEAGFDHHLVKPAGMTELDRILRQAA